MGRGISSVSQKLISRDGMMLWIPTHMSDIPNASLRLTDVDIYAESASQLFPLGTRLEYADGRLFRYGKWAETTTRPGLSYNLMQNSNAAGAVTGFVGEDGFEGNCYVAGAVGDLYVDMWTIIAASGTGIRTTVYPKDFFEDGMLAVYPAVGCVEYRICGNDATTTPFTRVYLENAQKYALVVGTTAAYVTGGTLTASTGGSGITAYTSMYSQLKTMGSEGATYNTCVGACPAPVVTSGSFGWIQRRGRCIVGPSAYFGDSADERLGEPQPNGNGAMRLRSSYTSQVLGYLTQRTVSGYGDLEVWLQLE